MYSTVKYTDETINSRKEKLEWKVRKATVGYNMSLAPFDFVFFPQLKSDLYGKRFSDLDELCTESDLKNDMVW